ncbi:MAG: hypothetical protein JSS75_13405 [Bacteroidetes bacterium]|nr:hypothetical protein [Bacteroidota bacterium]
MRNYWSKQIAYGIRTLKIAGRILEKEKLSLKRKRTVEAIICSTLETLRWMHDGSKRAVRDELRKHGLVHLLDTYRQL